MCEATKKQRREAVAPRRVSRRTARRLLRVELRRSESCALGRLDDELRIRGERADRLQAVALAADRRLRSVLRILADARGEAGDRRHVLHLDVDFLRTGADGDDRVALARLEGELALERLPFLEVGG